MQHPVKGPVHINVPFSEPLYETVNEFLVQSELIKIKKNTASFSISNSDAKKWRSSKRKMVLVGVNPSKKCSRNLFKIDCK